MPEIKKNEDIEERIEDEIVVDAYGEEERFMGWNCYLNDKIQFPFEAKCIHKSKISPLQVGEIVKVFGTIEKYPTIFVEIEWSGRKFGVPLAQLEGIDIDDESKEAIGDWHYWVNQDYQF